MILCKERPIILQRLLYLLETGLLQKVHKIKSNIEMHPITLLSLNYTKSRRIFNRQTTLTTN